MNRDLRNDGCEGEKKSEIEEMPFHKLRRKEGLRCLELQPSKS